MKLLLIDILVDDGSELFLRQRIYSRSDVYSSRHTIDRWDLAVG